MSAIRFLWWLFCHFLSTLTLQNSCVILIARVTILFYEWMYFIVSISGFLQVYLHINTSLCGLELRFLDTNQYKITSSHWFCAFKIRNIIKSLDISPKTQILSSSSILKIAVIPLQILNSNKFNSNHLVSLIKKCHILIISICKLRIHINQCITIWQHGGRPTPLFWTLFIVLPHYTYSRPP